MRDRHAYPEYPVLLSVFNGEFCLRLKPYLVGKISSDVLTEHCCQVCILPIMFCRSDCRLCAGMCGKWLRNQETPHTQYQLTTCFGLLTLRQANMGYEKYSLHLIFIFYLNRDTLLLELFPVVVFRPIYQAIEVVPKQLLKLLHSAKRSTDFHIDTYYCKPELKSRQ